MKILVINCTILFLIILPISLLKEHYSIFETYQKGKIHENVIVEKTDSIGYSTRRNYYVYVNDTVFKVRIRVPFMVNNELKKGDKISYFYITGNSFGVYDTGLNPYSFFLDIILIIVGCICIFQINRKM